MQGNKKWLSINSDKTRIYYNCGSFRSDERVSTQTFEISLIVLVIIIKQVAYQMHICMACLELHVWTGIVFLLSQSIEKGLINYLKQSTRISEVSNELGVQIHAWSPSHHILTKILCFLLWIIGPRLKFIRKLQNAVSRFWQHNTVLDLRILIGWVAITVHVTSHEVTFLFVTWVWLEAAVTSCDFTWTVVAMVEIADSSIIWPAVTHLDQRIAYLHWNRDQWMSP